MRRGRCGNEKRVGGVTHNEKEDGNTHVQMLNGHI